MPDLSKRERNIIEVARQSGYTGQLGEKARQLESGSGLSSGDTSSDEWRSRYEASERYRASQRFSSNVERGVTAIKQHQVSMQPVAQPPQQKQTRLSDAGGYVAGTMNKEMGGQQYIMERSMDGGHFVGVNPSARSASVEIELERRASEYARTHDMILERTEGGYIFREKDAPYSPGTVEQAPILDIKGKTGYSLKQESPGVYGVYYDIDKGSVKETRDFASSSAKTYEGGLDTQRGWVVSPEQRKDTYTMVTPTEKGFGVVKNVILGKELGTTQGLYYDVPSGMGREQVQRQSERMELYKIESSPAAAFEPSGDSRWAVKTEVPAGTADWVDLQTVVTKLGAGDVGGLATQWNEAVNATAYNIRGMLPGESQAPLAAALGPISSVSYIIGDRDITPRIVATAATGTYLFIDTKFWTDIVVVTPVKAVGFAAGKVAEYGITRGIFETGKAGVGYATGAMGAFTRIGTDVFPKFLTKGKSVLGEGTKQAIQHGAGAIIIGATAADVTGVAKNPIGRGVSDVGVKLGRYASLTSKPGERADIIQSAAIYNIPYYSLKGATAVAGTTTAGRASEVLYRGLNVASGYLLWERERQRVVAETGKEDFALATGRWLGEMGIFEVAFEQQTIDKAFESSGIYKSISKGVTKGVESGKISPREYGGYWSAIEYESPMAVSRTMVKPGSFETRGAKVEPKGVAPEARVEQPSRTEIRLEGMKTGRIGAELDIRFADTVRIRETPSTIRTDIPIRAEFKADIPVRSDFRTDIPIRFDVPVDVRTPETRTEEPIRIETPVRTDIRLDIGAPGMVFGGALPFLPLDSGGGGGSADISKRIKVEGQVGDLFSAFRGSERRKGFEFL